jgi:amidophosphoribosyltransferase
MKRQYAILLLFFSFQSIFSEPLQHECGIALVRLFKPLSYYKEKYQDVAWGLHKICLLMEKQRNRGQDGVGIAVMQFDLPVGYPFTKRYRITGKNALESLFTHIQEKNAGVATLPHDADDLSIKRASRMMGEIYLGHLRYATYGGNSTKFSQPYSYKNSIPAKSLMLAGNFNMTNSGEILRSITSCGIVPSNKADTQLIISQIGYCFDRAYEHALAMPFQKQSMSDACEAPSVHLDIASAIKHAALYWDGGYVFAGIVGNGDLFICRDPAGIRPGFYYANEEFFAAASERSALVNAFNVNPDQIKEIPRAHLIIIRKSGKVEEVQFVEQLPARECVFERIYFSRPNDPDIYRERKALGIHLADRLFKELEYDARNAVFSYIPNSSESSFYGLVEEINRLQLNYTLRALLTSGKDTFTEEDIKNLMQVKVRVEKLIYKDQMIRTFIANDTVRSDLVSKVYDVTKGIVSDQDTLIAIDDSIVRGVTMQQSIIKRLIALNPKKIIILSAAPIILYPDCYGIDMSQIGRLIGFQAAIALTQERGNQALIDDIYKECVALKATGITDCYNPVKKLYDQFTQEELEAKIAQLIYPHNATWHHELKVIFQTIEGLHQAIPKYKGDWYFTGNYPTLGGYKVLINSYINWYTAHSDRAY